MRRGKFSPSWKFEVLPESFIRCYKCFMRHSILSSKIISRWTLTFCKTVKCVSSFNKRECFDLLRFLSNLSIATVRFTQLMVTFSRGREKGDRKHYLKTKTAFLFFCFSSLSRESPHPHSFLCVRYFHCSNFPLVYVFGGLLPCECALMG